MSDFLWRMAIVLGAVMYSLYRGNGDYSVSTFAMALCIFVWLVVNPDREDGPHA